mmetsp:Transcript_101595/g.327869  ORF Transcript_101595/g.327869 Transcript_101595/m.327869 type:complete len:254 (-) Transcript_101595:135-896(-)
MVIPFGGMVLQQDDIPVPDVIKKVHSYRWWSYLLLLVLLCTFDIVVFDIFGAIFDGIMGIIVWFMIRNDCSQMTQYCLMLFGIMCLVQGIFGIIALVGTLGGRKTEHTSVTPLGTDNRQMAYTTIVETHPFFDDSMGFRYNCQSAVKIATPIVMLIGAILAYMSYSCFPSSMFGGDDAGDAYGQPFGGQMGGNYGGYDNRPSGGGGSYGGVRPFEGRGQALGGGGSGGGQVVGARTGAPPRLFEGSGQRLGNN